MPEGLPWRGVGAAGGETQPASDRNVGLAGETPIARDREPSAADAPTGAGAATEIGRATQHSSAPATQHSSAPATQHSSAPATQHPAALLYGTGHIVVYGNPPFQALFGAPFLGLPAAEALLALPRAAFELMDLVYREGRPLARWITMGGVRWRLTVAERRDIGTGKVYGIAVHLVPREDRDPAR